MPDSSTHEGVPRVRERTAAAHASRYVEGDATRRNPPDEMVAERVGFEPTVAHRTTTVFETAPFNHSGTSPGSQAALYTPAPRAGPCTGVAVGTPTSTLRMNAARAHPGPLSATRLLSTEQSLAERGYRISKRRVPRAPTSLEFFTRPPA